MCNSWYTSKVDPAGIEPAFRPFIGRHPITLPAEVLAIPFGVVRVLHGLPPNAQQMLEYSYCERYASSQFHRSPDVELNHAPTAYQTVASPISFPGWWTWQESHLRPTATDLRSLPSNKYSGPCVKESVETYTLGGIGRIRTSVGGKPNALSRSAL